MPAVPPAQIARLHVESLYRLGRAGRITEIREPYPPPPPRFFLFRGSGQIISLVSQELTSTLADQLFALAATEAPEASVAPAHVTDYRALLNAHRPIEREYSGPSLYLPAASDTPDGAVAIDSGNRDLLLPHFPEEARDFEARRPIYAIVEDGVAVALCFSARYFGPATPAGVFTTEPYRGRGYAGRLVGAWAAEVARLGSIPLYGTTWDNAASRAIAARLGARTLGADFWIR